MEIETKNIPTSISHDFSFDSSFIMDCVANEEYGDATLYLTLFKDIFRFDHNISEWYIWRENYWQLDKTGIHRYAMQNVINLYRSETGRQAELRLEAIEHKDKDAEKLHYSNYTALIKRIKDLQKHTRIKNVLEFAKSFRKGDSLDLTGDEWDLDPMIIGCKNCTISLVLGSERPGTQIDYIKKVVPTEYQGMSFPAPAWEQFISEIFSGDVSLTGYIQRLLGYAMTGHSFENITPILWGQGRNGKSTLLETLYFVLGELAGPIESEMLLKQRFAKNSGGPTSDIMALRGKRLVWANETDEGRRLSVGKLKWLTGGDTLTGRQPHAKRQISFKPSHTLFLLTNHKPSAPASDYALWKRIHLIPFNLSFVDNPKLENEKKADKELGKKLRAEAPGILAWLVKGCLSWQKEGLNPPQIVMDTTEAYRLEEDILGAYISDNCWLPEDVPGIAKESLKASLFYKNYEQWCHENGFRPFSSVIFGREMAKRFVKEKKEKSNYYLGVRLRVKYEEKTT